MISLSINEKEVKASTTEGGEATASVERFVRDLAPPQISTGGLVLIGGCLAFLTRGNLGVLLHQTPPGVRNLKWIAENSDTPFGSEAAYSSVQIALPYVIVCAVFQRGSSDNFRLSHYNECFFSNEPLTDLTQQLSYPALLNCSKFDPAEGHPLSWICTQYLNTKQTRRIKDPNKQMHSDLKALLHCLFETGFNYSSEHHEGNSWYSASKKADKRLETMDAWEQATREDPWFALDVPWLETGLSAAKIVDRIFHIHGAKDQTYQTAEDLARVVFHGKQAKKTQ